MSRSRTLNMRGKRLLIGAILSGFGALAGSVPAEAQFQPPPPEDFSHAGWLAVSGGGAVVEGNRATFEQRHQQPGRASGGLESFFWESFQGDLIMQIRARSIFDENENDLSLGLVNADTGGFFRAGIREFRTRFDGSSGYFSPSDTWFSPDDGGMHIDRGEVWLEAGFDNPGTSSIITRYTHRYRRGMKDSTIWGEAAVAPGTLRNIAPAFREIDESEHIFEARGERTVGNTDLGLGLRYQKLDRDNELSVRVQPGGVNERTEKNREGADSDIFTGHAWTSTELNEKTRFSTGYVFSRMDVDFIGEREFDPAPSGFDREVGDLEGWSQVQQHVANVNVLFNPWEHFYIIPSIRGERRDTEVNSGFDQTDSVRSDKDAERLSERLELRYSGLKKWHLFIRGDWSQEEGSLEENGTVSRLPREVDFDRNSQRYTAGANWHPHSKYSIAFQYYHEIRENENDHIIRGRTNQDIENHDFTTNDFNVRLTLYPVDRVTLVSRYDLRLSEIDTRASRPDIGNPSQRLMLDSIQSGEKTRQIFSQSATWSPLDRLYLLASANYAKDTLETPAQDAGGATERRVLTSENDYLFANLGLGFAYSDKTNLDLSYTYYLADNFTDNSDVSVAYGVGEYEHGVKANFIHRMTETFMCFGGYGFYLYREDTTGGNRDYDAHLVYVGLGLSL